MSIVSKKFQMNNIVQNTLIIEKKKLKGIRKA